MTARGTSSFVASSALGRKAAGTFRQADACRFLGCDEEEDVDDDNKEEDSSPPSDGLVDGGGEEKEEEELPVLPRVFGGSMGGV